MSTYEKYTHERLSIEEVVIYSKHYTTQINDYFRKLFDSITNLKEFLRIELEKVKKEFVIKVELNDDDRAYIKEQKEELKNDFDRMLTEHKEEIHQMFKDKLHAGNVLFVSGF